MKLSGLFAIRDHLKRLWKNGWSARDTGSNYQFRSIQVRARCRAGLLGGHEGWPAAVRSGGDVQGADPGGAEHRHRRAHGVFSSGMAELASLPGFPLGDRTPDENTIRLFRERLTRSGRSRSCSRSSIVSSRRAV